MKTLYIWRDTDSQYVDVEVGEVHDAIVFYRAAGYEVEVSDVA